MSEKFVPGSLGNAGITSTWPSVVVDVRVVVIVVVPTTRDGLGIGLFAEKGQSE